MHLILILLGNCPADCYAGQLYKFVNNKKNNKQIERLNGLSGKLSIVLALLVVS
jgi:hypothetical protein